MAQGRECNGWIIASWMTKRSSSRELRGRELASADVGSADVRRPHSGDRTWSLTVCSCSTPLACDPRRIFTLIYHLLVFGHISLRLDARVSTFSGSFFSGTLQRVRTRTAADRGHSFVPYSFFI